MKQLQTKGIVLTRTNYGEADRILTVLTPEYGKLSLIARGARRQKSKLAAGVELFSVSDISFMKGRGEIGTLTSTRLIKHYGRIVTNMERVQLGYELLKQLHRATEDQPETAYFMLLEQAFAALDDQTIALVLIRAWFTGQLLELAGHRPNLQTAADGQPLLAGQQYSFDFDNACFAAQEHGPFNTDAIKFLRLIFGPVSPHALSRVQGGEVLSAAVLPLLQTMAQLHIRS